MEIQVNFLEDWRQHLLESMKAAGYKPKASSDVDTVTYMHHNFLRREISPQPRTAYEPKGFFCNCKNRRGYQRLLRKIRTGTSVNPHLSRLLKNPRYEDLMLNDWGIHHFHIGRKMDKDGFVKRTGPLLYAYVTESDFYVLGIFKHGQWASKKLLRVMYKNWPAVIKPYRIKGVVDLSRSLSEQELGRMRAGRLNVLIELKPGILYMGPGGGIATSKASIKARVAADRDLNFIEKLQTRVLENSSVYRVAISKHGRPVPIMLDFELVIGQTGIYALEKTSKVQFLLHKY